MFNFPQRLHGYWKQSRPASLPPPPLLTLTILYVCVSACLWRTPISMYFLWNIPPVFHSHTHPPPLHLYRWDPPLAHFYAFFVVEGDLLKGPNLCRDNGRPRRQQACQQERGPGTEEGGGRGRCAVCLGPDGSNSHLPFCTPVCRFLTEIHLRASGGAFRFRPHCLYFFYFLQNYHLSWHMCKCTDDGLPLS